MRGITTLQAPPPHLSVARSGMQQRIAAPGFTLVELVVAIVVIGIISAFVIPRSVSSAQLTLPSQARKMAGDLRRVQTLASTWGRSLRVAVTTGPNGTYSVSCVIAGAAPCNTNANAPVIDPATGESFSVSLQNNVSLAGPATLDFDSSGKPSAAASYSQAYGDATATVGVAALTGNVTVSP